ncbi:hypothetical protein FA09DRAFT_176444 [Tilletiopsis washingtonensis]|uniref:Uncharacterized protein n=1 Tax=Tilletiopsis washingtonensis TaxID=58919 RepID=A0A316YYK3_9BASI|nr:hypothetical protein FA09DRAFT_176444 [Tilletiopsis washingtonensis]PWN94537.1 hypothetical protein FA09DRAFT_176444 [Tilletiopsis washingtonensis]
MVRRRREKEPRLMDFGGDGARKSEALQCLLVEALAVGHARAELAGQRAADAVQAHKRTARQRNVTEKRERQRQVADQEIRRHHAKHDRSEADRNRGDEIDDSVHREQPREWRRRATRIAAHLEKNEGSDDQVEQRR